MRKYIWMVLALIYGAFFFWYNDFSGPLTEEEIAHYESLPAAGMVTADMLQTARIFMEEDDGGDFIMVNFLKYREDTKEVDGAQMTAREAMDKYSSFVMAEILKRGSLPVATGDVAGGFMDRVGITQDVRWDSVGLVRYRSRRDAMELGTHPEFFSYHHYKVAAVETAFAVPVTNWALLITFQLFVPMLLLLIGFVLTFVFPKLIGALSSRS